MGFKLFQCILSKSPFFRCILNCLMWLFQKPKRVGSHKKFVLAFRCVLECQRFLSSCVSRNTAKDSTKGIHNRSNTAPELLILVPSKLSLRQKRRDENKLTSHSSRCRALSAFQVFSPEGELKHECFQKIRIYPDPIKYYSIE